MAKAKPRLPARKKPLRPKQISHYARCKALWEKAPKEGGDWLVDRPELPLDAVAFLATLRALGYQLQDQRCHDLHRDLRASGLIDPKTGKWSHFGTVLGNPETRHMCELIEETIATPDFTEHEAIADAVVQLGLNAASFYAAWKRVERLLKAYRKFVVHGPA
jgi:hypothetical protein